MRLALLLSANHRVINNGDHDPGIRDHGLLKPAPMPARWKRWDRGVFAGAVTRGESLQGDDGGTKIAAAICTPWFLVFLPSIGWCQRYDLGVALFTLPTG